MGEAKHRDESWLREKYWEEGMSLVEVAERAGVSDRTVLDWMERHGIERRSLSEANQTDGKHTDPEWLRKEYLEKERSAKDISDDCKVSESAILNKLGEFGIEKRKPGHGLPRGDPNAKYRDEEWLREKYKSEEKPIGEIADIAGVAPSAVYTWMVNYGIERRSKTRSGEDAANWKGGGPRYYGSNWESKRSAAIDRDSGECQVCGMGRERHREMYGRDIEVHHIRPIRLFDKPENANFLENLITLCKKHHKIWEGIPLRPVTPSD
jgi:transposase